MCIKFMYIYLYNQITWIVKDFDHITNNKLVG